MGINSKSTASDKLARFWMESMEGACVGTARTEEKRRKAKIKVNKRASIKKEASELRQ